MSHEFEETPVSVGPLKLKYPIGVGTWAWGDSLVWGYGSYDKDFSDTSIDEAFSYCVEKGIQLWDTAEVYGRGRSETILGNCIKRHDDLCRQQNVMIASKFFPMPWNVSRSSFRSSLQESLKRLQVQCLDLYQIHSPAFTTRTCEYWAESLGDAVKAGLIKTVGVSNFSIEQVRRTHAVLKRYGVPLAVNQIEFSLLRNNPDRSGMLDVCKELGVTVLAYSPLGMGRLTGKYNKNNSPQGWRLLSNYNMAEVDPIVDVLKEIGQLHNKTPSQVAINWVICKGAVPLVGVKNRRQAEDNFGALGWRLTPEEVKVLDAVSKSQSWSFQQYDSHDPLIRNYV